MREIASLVVTLGLLLALGAIADGCGSPSLLQCRADAAADLPLEPDQITLGDVRQVVRKVKACQAAARLPAGASGDAGP